VLPKIGKLVRPLPHPKLVAPPGAAKFAAHLRNIEKTCPAKPLEPRVHVPERARIEEEPRRRREREHEREERPACASPFPATVPTMEDALVVPRAMPVATAAPAPAPSAAAVVTQTLAPELLDQAAFWGDGARGVARLRFGSRAKGALRGAMITLEHDGEGLSLRVEGDAELAATLRERLAKRGLPMEDD
jgi:hypothetical protein